MGTEGNLFRLVPVLGQGARVLPLELEPLPGHGAQTCAQVPTKGHLKFSARAQARAPSLNGALDSPAGAVLVRNGGMFERSGARVGMAQVFQDTSLRSKRFC